MGCPSRTEKSLFKKIKTINLLYHGFYPFVNTFMSILHNFCLLHKK